MKTLIKLILISFSGFILSLSAPNYGFWILAWIGLIPLFILLYVSDDYIEMLLGSFLFGFFYNLSYLHWLYNLHPLTWLGLSNNESIIVSLLSLTIVSLYNSIYYVLFGLLFIFLKYCFPKTKMKSLYAITLTSFFWIIVFNKISSLKSLVGFPWTLIEYSQYKNIYLIQIADMFGSLGVSFLIVFFNLVLSNTVTWIFNVEKIGNRYIPKKPGDFSNILKSLFFILILMTSSYFYGLYSYKKYTSHFSKKSKSIIVLQGNLPIKATRGKNMDISFSKKTYSGLLSKNNADLIIFPEGAFPTILDFDQKTKMFLKWTSSKKNCSIIAGTYCNSKDMLTNCAVSILPNDDNLSFYHKERLVPFGEYVPFYKGLPSPLKKFADYIIGDGFSEGKGKEVLKTNIGTAGVNVCFEIVYPEIIRNFSLKGAKFIINISDLSWFSSDHIKKQFLSFAVFRAIENRKPIIVGSNNGISSFIESNGQIKSQTLPGLRGVLIDWINPRKEITFYSRYGW